MSMHRMIKAVITIAALGAWLAIGSPAYAQTPPHHVRGTIESVQGQTVSVKTAGGATDAIELAPGAKVFLVSPADMSAIKDGKFVGVTSVEKDGKRVAVEVHVRRLTARPWRGPLSLGSRLRAQHDDQRKHRPSGIGRQ